MPFRTVQDLVEQRSLSLTDLGEIWTVREEPAVPNDEVTFVHEGNAVRSGKLYDAFAVQTGQTVNHHKPRVRPFPLHRCEGSASLRMPAASAPIRQPDPKSL